MSEKITGPAKRFLSTLLTLSMLMPNSMTVLAEETISDETEIETVEKTDDVSEVQISTEEEIPDEVIEETEETVIEEEPAESESAEEELQELTEAEETAEPVFDHGSSEIAMPEDIGITSLSGTVKDQSGQGISGLTVFAYDTTDKVFEGRYETNNSGTWTVSDLQEEHQYVISYYHRDYDLSKDRFFITAGTVNTLDDVSGTKLNSGFTETDGSVFTTATVSGTNIRLTGYSGALESVVIPAVINGSTVTELGADLFRGHTELKEVVIPDSVTVIGNHVFDGCTSLEEVWLGKGLTSIGNYAFYNCTGLKEIRLPNTVTAIGSYAFQNCTGITAVNIPESLTGIGANAFAKCNKLTEVNHPVSLTTGSGAFSGTAITKVKVEEGVWTIADYIFSGAVTIQEVELPSTLNIIGNHAFEGSKGLTGITVPSSVTSIGNYAFSECTGMKEVNLNEGLTSIGNYAFKGCTELTAVELPDSVRSLGVSVFLNSSKLSEVNYPLSWTSAGSGIFAGTAVKRIEIPEGVTAIPANAYNGTGSLTEAVLPSTLKGISDYAFAGCTGLNGIEIPSGVTNIGNHAFEGSKGLTGITVPSSVTTIGNYAFSECTGMKEVNLNEGLTSIGNYAFKGCTELTAVELPDSVSSLGVSVFLNSSKLSEVNYPLSWTGAGSGIFAGTAVKRIEIPEGVTAIPANALSGCTSLRYVSMPSTLKTIGSRAFEGCTHLVYVTVPQKVTSIGNYAFNGCSSLRLAELYSLSITIGNNVFNEVHADFKIVCPSNSDAIEYAVSNNLKFETIDVDNPDSVMEKDSTVYTRNISGNSNSGCTDLLLNYKIDDSSFAAMSNMNLVITFNENLQIYDEKINLNGNISYDYRLNDSILTVPVSSQTGNLKVSVKRGTYSRFASIAKMTWKENGVSRSEIIGFIYDETPEISLNLPQNFNANSFSVDGIAPAGANITLSVDGTPVQSVLASKAGFYTADLTIDNPTDGKIYTVTASTTIDGAVSLRSGKIKYVSYAPQVLSFKLYYTGHSDENCCDILDVQERKKNIVFYPKIDYRFEVTLSNPQNVSHVYVTSTRNGVTKMLEASWNETKQVYEAVGPFDPKNRNYVPGTLSVAFAKSEGLTDYYSGLNIEDEEYFKDIPENLIGAEAEPVTTVTENGVTTMTTAITLNDEEQSRIDVRYTEQNSNQNASTLLANGYVEVNGANGHTGYVKVEIKDYEIEQTVYDKTINKLYTTLIKKNGGGDLMTLWGYGEAGMVGVMNVAMTYFEIQNSNMSASERAEAMRQLESLKDYYGSQLALTYVFYVAGIMCPVLSTPLKYIKDAVDKTLLEYYNRQIAGTNMSWNGIRDFFFDTLLEPVKEKLKWIIDPSGTIYEGNTDGTLEGVTVTVYYKDPETGEVSEWNADEYDQINPIITTPDGTFSWDVPEGLWQVKAEKAGYETVYTEWLEVPPPQTGLIIRMNPTEAPSVETVKAYTDGIDVTFSQYMNTETLNNLKVKDTKGNDVAYELVPGTVGKDEAGNEYTRSVRLVFAKEKTYGTILKLVSGAALISAAGAELTDVDETLTVGFRGIEKEIAFRHSCSFGNNLAINYYAPIDALEGYENIRMEVRKQIFNDDGSISWEAAELKNYTQSTQSGVKYYRFVYSGIAPKEMGAEVRMVLLCEKNGETYVSEEDVYGIGTYAYNRLSASTNAVFKTLIVDMLNYGAEAQKYFKYNTANLVNADLTEEQKALGTQQVPELKSVEKDIETAGATATFYGKSAVFNANVEMKYYMQFAEGQSLDNVKLVLTYTAIDGKAYTEEITASNFGYDKSKKAYTAKLISIAAKDVGCTVTAKIYDGDTLISNTLEYSLETYAYNRLIKSTDEVFKAFLREFMKYGFSAKAYFEKNN